MTDQTLVLELTKFTEELNEVEQYVSDENRTYLSTHIAGDLVFHRTDGSVVGKQQYIDKWASGSPYRSRVISDLVVKPSAGDPNRSVTTLLIHTVNNDGSYAVFRNIRFCAKRDGNWQIYAWYNTQLHSI
jgi:hypothetical protein